MASTWHSKETISEALEKEQTQPSSQEELSCLPLEGAEEGMTPLRLLEPISSLNLTPFAMKAVRGLEKSSVGALAAMIFEKGTECRGLGQSHLEEIQRKIEEFVGKPPYGKDHRFDPASLLRIGFSSVDSVEKAIVVTVCRLQPMVPVSTQEGREVEMALMRDKQRKIVHAFDTIRPKASEKLIPLLATICDTIVKPWMNRRGGIAHEQEIMQFLFERSGCADYGLFSRAVHALNLLAERSFLFYDQLLNVKRETWAASAQQQQQALSVLADAKH